MAYKLYLSKTQTQPTVVTPWRWMMKYMVEPFLKTVTYYRVDDGTDNLIIEVTDVPAVVP
ncbi:hypothetical protein [Janthinobacterium sp. NKUCC06_STL]|uniref:hypothetical protein n=1 Tax=Janthinobacterium sp. NKUCC06_STL TaxID=2842127 RepID=UPI001C5AA5C9|nr:hypothetical protein [Janthinobacterium sp. NKUCC06_STL]MBW3512093.1 hypothetical protein [Janthinobacterium sp. NKUCC06_STL]